MPRPAKGARLYLRRGRVDRRTGEVIPAYWFIRDGSSEFGTGCAEADLGGPSGAEAKLGEYIARKNAKAPARQVDKRDPAQVLVSDVLTYYAADHGSGRMDPATFDGMVELLGERLGRLPIADIRRSSCKAYVERRLQDADRRYTKDPANAPRVSSETARRELEILSAAIGYWNGEHKLTSRPTVWLPDKPESQRDALTRSQAAALLLAALGWRKEADGRWRRLGGSARANRAHLRRFVVIGVYSGSRPGVTLDGLWEESPTLPWFDVDRGTIWRRGREIADIATKRRPVAKMSRRLRAHLERWRRLDRALKAKGKLETNAVIHHGGEPLAGKIRTGFEGIVRDAGLSAEITPHWMRHTCATWLMEAGVDMWDAAGYAGMTVKVLEDHYAHHRPDYQAAATKAHSRRPT